LTEGTTGPRPHQKHEADKLVLKRLQLRVLEDDLTKCDHNQDVDCGVDAPEYQGPDVQELVQQGLASRSHLREATRNVK
jgi:hypothetical protein